MSNIIEVRGVRIGEGIPKIIVPIVGTTREEIFAAAVSLKNRRMDLVEWRADWYDDVSDHLKTEDILRDLRNTLPQTPILFTFRTAGEGGEKAVEKHEYARIIINAAQSGFVDLVDVEAFTGDEIVREIIEAAHAAGVKVVGSNHDFDKTPPKEEIVRRLRKMQEMGADIPKIAVMPHSKRDVLALLGATEKMSTVYADRPIITMAMSGTGLISRLCGEAFGSSCTFGAIGKASAPGQMNAEDLDTILKLIHDNT